MEDFGVVLTTYTTEEIPILGKAEVGVQYENQKHKLVIYVTEGNQA